MQNEHNIVLVGGLPQVFQLMQQKVAICEMQLLGFLQRSVPDGCNSKILQTIINRRVGSQMEHGVVILQLIDYLLASLGENMIARRSLMEIQARQESTRKQTDMLVRAFEAKTSHCFGWEREDAINKVETNRLKARAAQLQAELRNGLSELEAKFTHKPTRQSNASTSRATSRDLPDPLPQPLDPRNLNMTKQRYTVRPGTTAASTRIKLRPRDQH